MKFKKIKSRIIAISLAMASVATPLTASSLAPPVMAADTFTGIKNGVYYENGKVTGKKNGFILTTYNGKKAYWNIRNSKLVKGPTVAKGVDWWYVDKEGKVE